MVDPGNRLSIYDKVSNQGIFDFNDSLTHQFVYELKDAEGNTSRLTGYLKASPIRDTLVKKTNSGHWFDYDTNNEFKGTDIELSFDKGSFYKSFDFSYDTLSKPENAYSLVHRIHQRTFPVHRSFDIKIKAVKLPEHLQKKAIIAKLDKKEIGAVGGTYKDGYVYGKAGSFGDYLIVADTVQPQIKALNVHNGKKISGYKSINFWVKDDLSGIASFRATLNGKWILLDDDPKNDRLTYLIDDRINKGKNHIRLEVIDNCGNSSVFEADFEY